MWCKRALALWGGLALAGCGATQYHEECVQAFDVCSGQCSPRCEDHSHGPVAEDHSPHLSTQNWDSGSCLMCVKHCEKARERCQTQRQKKDLESGPL